MQLQLSWAHGGVEINWLNLHDTLKINPRIRNYQKHKNSSQALHEDGKKSEEVWLNQEERNKKIGPYGFLYLYDRRQFGKNISLDILFDIFK